MTDRRPTDWQSITATREGWERFCWIVGMQIVVKAAQRVQEQASSIAEATNWAIKDTAQSIERDGAPAGMVDAFRQQYLADRANQMQLVADQVEVWREIEAKYPPRRKRRKSK